MCQQRWWPSGEAYHYTFTVTFLIANIDDAIVQMYSTRVFLIPQGYTQTLNVNTLLLFTRKPHREYFIIMLPTGPISLKAVFSFDVWYTSLLVIIMLEVILFNCF